MNKLVMAISVGMLGAMSTAEASGFNSCKEFFYKGFAPIVVNKKLSKDTTDVCYSGFALNYSGVSKTALWSAEYITPEHLAKAKQISREDTFHEDTRIPSAKRALLSDYKGSGYDRGHLAPNANRSDKLEQHQSFSLSNIVPQAPKSNQENWRKIEESVRTMVTKNREPVYIITGPLYLSKKVTKLGSGVLVPSHTYKVVFYPNRKVMGAYVTVNDNIARTDVVSVAQLQQHSGVIFFPTLQGHPVISQRHRLPLSANAAYKTSNIQAISGQSSIFEVMPDPEALPAAMKNRPSKKEAKEQAVNYIGNKLKKDTVALKQELEGLQQVFGK